MLVSASYRTDIPAFHGDAFMASLHAGQCVITSPYSHRTSTVTLNRDTVDGFVFWTKNLQPFLPRLEEVRAAGFPFMVQFSITGYSTALPALEPCVPPTEVAIAAMHEMADKFGRQAGVWRYDPIIATSETPGSFHLANFENLAGQLAGTVNEVVISFCQMYPKTKRGLDAAAKRHGFRWTNPPAERKKDMGAKLAGIAARHGMKLSLCSQEDLLAPGVQPASCVDAQRLATIGGREVKAQLKGNRPTCRCYKSTDIGAYNTCAHGCVYCYATQGQTQEDVQERIDEQKRQEADYFLMCRDCGADIPCKAGDDPTSSTGCCPVCGSARWSFVDAKTRQSLF